MSSRNERERTSPRLDDLPRRSKGEAQTERYLALLEDDFELLTSQPKLGRLAGTNLQPELRKFESGSHVVYYEITDECILIARNLHKRRLACRQGL